MKNISFGRRTAGFPLVVFLLLLLMGFSMFRAASLESQTWDEAIHLSAGYIYWKTGDYRFNSDHPILGKMLNALPLLFLDLEIPAAAHPDRVIETGREFLYENRVPADRILTLGRIVTILLTLGFGLVLALWARQRFGDGPALLTLLLFTFDPNLLAHGHLVTSDMFLTAFLTLAVLAWSWYLESGGGWRLLTAGVLAGLAAGQQDLGSGTGTHPVSGVCGARAEGSPGLETRTWLARRPGCRGAADPVADLLAGTGGGLPVLALEREGPAVRY